MEQLLPELSSPEVQAFASGFPIMLLHTLVTVLMLLAGATLYALITPWKEISLIREGNPAAAVAFGGVLVGLAIPLSVSLAVSSSVREIFIWGVATVLLQLLIFRLTQALLAGLPDRIREGEISAAVLLVSAKLATAIVLSAAVTG